MKGIRYGLWVDALSGQFTGSRHQNKGRERSIAGVGNKGFGRLNVFRRWGHGPNTKSPPLIFRAF